MINDFFSINGKIRSNSIEFNYSKYWLVLFMIMIFVISSSYAENTTEFTFHILVPNIPAEISQIEILPQERSV